MQKWPRSAGHLILGFALRKTKIPTIPQAHRRHHVTCHFVGFVKMRLICVPFKSYLIKTINTISIFTTDHCSVESTYLSYPSISSEGL